MKKIEKLTDKIVPFYNANLTDKVAIKKVSKF